MYATYNKKHEIEAENTLESNRKKSTFLKVCYKKIEPVSVYSMQMGISLMCVRFMIRLPPIRTGKIGLTLFNRQEKMGYHIVKALLSGSDLNNNIKYGQVK